jgi:hypothetical protein
MAMSDGTAFAHTRPFLRVSPEYFFTTAWLMRCRTMRALE